MCVWCRQSLGPTLPSPPPPSPHHLVGWKPAPCWPPPLSQLHVPWKSPMDEQLRGAPEHGGPLLPLPNLHQPSLGMWPVHPGAAMGMALLAGATSGLLRNSRSMVVLDTLRPFSSYQAHQGTTEEDWGISRETDGIHEALYHTLWSHAESCRHLFPCAVCDLIYNITMSRIHTSIQRLGFQSVLKQEIAFFDKAQTAESYLIAIYR
ncbi:uncharacterized protein LOC135521258 isoform X2 [Oncorhynchus masou masou]|uniref:uncharacterized protein LOC135521258 isoform X2 n=1 Tax=Oncorhynchus masou masou TaxID=90313 RepID=UPI003183A2C5